MTTTCKTYVCYSITERLGAYKAIAVHCVCEALLHDTLRFILSVFATLLIIIKQLMGHTIVRFALTYQVVLMIVCYHVIFSKMNVYTVTSFNMTLR